MTEKKDTPTAQHFKQAEQAMRSELQANFPRFLADHDDFVQQALTVWSEDSKQNPGLLVRRVARDHARKQGRQSRIRGEGPRSNLRLRRYREREESELKAAVRAHCEAAYVKTWGKPWEPECVPPLTHERDEAATNAETEASKSIGALRSALEAAVRSIDALLADGDGMAVGPAGYRLAMQESRIRELIGELDQPWEMRRLAPTPLRRFVERVMERADDRAIAVMWLLSSGWPNVRSWPATVAAVIGAACRAVRAARRDMAERETKP